MGNPPYLFSVPAPIRSLYSQRLSDNMTVVVYINKQGGARSHSLCVEAIFLWNWCLRHRVTSQDVHLMSSSNSLVDTLRRSFYMNPKWELHNPMLCLVFHQ